MPWHHEKPDYNLVRMVEKWPVPVGKVLELGCGTGTDAIWLAKNGFEVTAVDVSDIAISIAEKSAKKSGVKCFANESACCRSFGGIGFC